MRTSRKTVWTMTNPLGYSQKRERRLLRRALRDFRKDPSAAWFALSQKREFGMFRLETVFIENVYDGHTGDTAYTQRWVQNKRAFRNA